MKHERTKDPCRDTEFEQHNHFDFVNISVKRCRSLPFGEKGLIRFCHFYQKTKSLTMHLLLKEGIWRRLKFLRFLLVLEEPLSFLGSVPASIHGFVRVWSASLVSHVRFE